MREPDLQGIVRQRAVNGVVLLAGPTCSGKTELAIELAERFDAEIIGADSRQIYRGMPIGTAAPTSQQRARVAHHLIAILEPQERYSAARFVHDALAAIEAIVARGKGAIVVGGTGFYLRALAGDVALSAAYDERLRARLAREAHIHPPEVLHEWLTVRAPARAAALAPSDRYRIARALEIALAAPDSLRDDILSRRSLRSAALPFVKIALDIEAALLDERIAARVDAMLAAGFVAEAERIGAHAVASDAVGYPQALAFTAGWSTARELRSVLIRATRRYAKRQMTWLRSEPGIRWAKPADVADLIVDALGWRARRRMASRAT
ncbi:MAG: tRNA (adenosine(37)-N6)-dimethylallyltransferase MiaA [Candidatus Eremiobacteraeota bacterium]|nr:tRNA (adenosine(37)-N6)-dimethylallyltransferase MiaA [Candidatus Eremiobacteraeota bacterium]MBC5802555.1 tRNA (adenosine(37)-N6)-dimethylallyltransferase MiaA [Candidatus Eremiobacteraeota bacterium]MBC5821916.1 tRNA (adenosine(37)-N6)-dimethylallyltransferase MiaA [Candidatus Eremiobacteraeota bacterium]